ncbi:MAG: TIGR01777 family oxidoreductase [Planctomycetota bacterium]
MTSGAASMGGPANGHADAPRGALKFEPRVELPASDEEAFAWHDRPGAFERLTPPFEPAEVVAREGQGIRDGARVTLKVGPGPLRPTLVAHHSGYDPPRAFVDTQERGPFAHWRHEHRFEPRVDGGSVLTDSIRYRLPLQALSAPIAGGFVRRKLDAMFRYRHATTVADLTAHGAARAALEPRGQWPLRVLISGASGLIGSALCAYLTTGGHAVHRLVRREPRGTDEVRWNAMRGEVDPADVSGYDVVIHLAGAGIADKRWSEARMALIRDSRTVGTRALAEALARAEAKPRVFLSSSAVGVYGDRGDEELTEDSSQGEGFLADVGREWEAAADPARAAGIRVVHPRTGLVLSPAGGTLGKLLPPFRFGVGGPLGRGRMYMPWIGIDDMLDGFLHCIVREDLEGGVNFCAPTPERNADLSKTLARVLRRPCLFPVPPFVLRLMFGELADAALFASTRALPARLLESGYRFRHADLEPCLRHVLGR